MTWSLDPFPCDSVGKESACNAGDLDLWVGKILWKRERSPTPVFWPGEFHGQYSLCSCKESDTTEQLSFHMKSYQVIHFLKQFSSGAQSCPTLCDPMNRSTPGLPVHHQLLDFIQTHVHRVSDAIQPSHHVIPFSSCPQSLPASGSFLMSQLFASDGQGIGASGSASVLQHQSNQDYLNANIEFKGEFQLINISSTLFYKLCTLQVILNCVGFKSVKNT